MSIVLVVDRSGSMETIFKATESGINEFLEKQRELPNASEMKVSLVTFDDIIEHPITDKPLLDYVTVDIEHIRPRGSTALYDAIGHSIHVESEPRIVVIVTDGHENSSRTYTKSRILSKITQLRQSGWTFIFLAANQDAIASGAELGISGDLCCTFDADESHVKSAFKSVSGAVARQCSGQNAAFTPLERSSTSDASYVNNEDDPLPISRQTATLFKPIVM